MKKLLFLLPFLLLSCSKDEDNSVSSIKINEREVQLIVGETQKFTVSYSPTNAEKPFYTWETSDNKIAIIDTTGLLKALSDGEIIVRASTNSYPYITDEVPVTILPIAAESISIDSIANVYFDGSKCLYVKFYPEKSKEQEITWMSSNENVAMVSSRGCLNIKGVGSTVITATIRGTNISSSCKVSINHRNPNRQSVQCVATTKAGARCKRMTTNLNARCW